MMRREDLRGTWAMQREAEWPSIRRDELDQQALAYGLESADSIRDRSISLFNRGRHGYSAGCRFMGVPFLEDMHTLGGQDVAVVGVPLDCGTTFRSGTRWGPQAIRRISLLGNGYNPSLGVDLVESLNMVDAGDVNVIPANIEKSFDQIANYHFPASFLKYSLEAFRKEARYGTTHGSSRTLPSSNGLPGYPL